MQPKNKLERKSWGQMHTIENRLLKLLVFATDWPLSVTTEYSPDVKNVNETFDSDGCLYLFEPEYTDKELKEYDQAPSTLKNTKKY